MGFPKVTAAVPPTVDPVATHRQAMGDAVAAPIEPRLHAIAAPFERGGAALVSVVGLPVRTAVEAGFDAVAAMIETPLHDRRAVMQALVDPITAPVEMLADA